MRKILALILAAAACGGSRKQAAPVPAGSHLTYWAGSVTITLGDHGSHEVTCVLARQEDPTVRRVHDHLVLSSDGTRKEVDLAIAVEGLAGQPTVSGDLGSAGGFVRFFGAAWHWSEESWQLESSAGRVSIHIQDRPDELEVAGTLDLGSAKGELHGKLTPISKADYDRWAAPPPPLVPPTGAPA
jgi:hypothetical protein